MTAPTPLLDLLKRGEMARDVRLLAAQGALAPRAHEQIALLILLVDDADAEVRTVAGETIDRIPVEPLRAFLARTDVPVGMREFFAGRGILPADVPAASADDPLLDAAPEVETPADASEPGGPERGSITQQLAKMGFSERLKAAVKGSREMRAVLIRDPNKLISSTVLSSPKLTEQEVEAFSRMANVGEDVLRIIASNRAWVKNYSVVVGLTKNPKTPLGLSLNMMNRLNDRDLQMLSIDRNVPEPLRVAARKKLLAGSGGRG
jgi:hypothetical protein